MSASQRTLDWDLRLCDEKSKEIKVHNVLHIWNAEDISPRQGVGRLTAVERGKSCPFLDKAAFSCLLHRLSFLMYLVDDCMHFACNMQLRD